MNPRQYARMQKKNALKREEKRLIANPVEITPIVAPIVDEDAALFERALKTCWKSFYEQNAHHWLWRAGQLLEYVERHGYRSDAPKSKSGRRIPMRKQIGLPPDPVRIAFQDDVIAAVEVKVKSLPNKGVVPIYKTVGRRELQDRHTKASAYVRDPNSGAEMMHVCMKDPISPRDLIKWLRKIIALTFIDESGTSKLERSILGLERLYAAPRDIVQGFAYGPPAIRLISAGSSQSPSKPVGHGRAGMARVARRSRRYHHLAQMGEDTRAKMGEVAYMQRQRIANRAFGRERHENAM